MKHNLGQGAPANTQGELFINPFLLNKAKIFSVIIKKLNIKKGIKERQKVNILVSFYIGGQWGSVSIG